MASGLVMACLLAMAAGGVDAASDGESEPMEIFIQHTDADAESEPVEVFIQHSEPAPASPAASPAVQPVSPPPPAMTPSPAPSGVREPIEASARTLSPSAFLAIGDDPSSEMFAEGQGSASVEVTDRVDQPQAPQGDSATMSATIRVGVDVWRVTSTSVGQPSDSAAAGFAFGFPVQGGVRVGDLVLGRTGIPFKGAAAAIAAFSLFGTARVEHNGQVVAEGAPLEVVALTTGVHADDDTHRRMRNARAGDLELLVFVPQLPRGATPNGFLLMTFEDVALDVQNHSVPSARYIPTVSPLNPEDVGNDPFGLKAPAFRSAARSPASADLVPLLPVGLIATPRPLNAAPAQTLIQGIDVVQGSPIPLHGGAVDPSRPADTLPQGIAVLHDSPVPLIGGAADPSRPAETLIQGIAPLNAQPLALDVGGPLPIAIGPGPLRPPQPTHPQVLPPIPPQTVALPTLTPPANASP